MQKTTKLSPVLPDPPIELQHLRVVAYCRVSTEQEEQSSSIELQEQHYSRLISQNPNWKNAGIFSERASGLSLRERPEFHRMVKLCQRKKIDLILTKSISRFGRNTLDMLRTLQTLNDCGTEVYFEKEKIWLSRQHMKVLLIAYCALAQAESEDMSRDIKWGIKRGFQNGTSGYAEFVCFGYKRGDGGKLAIDEPDAMIVRKMFRMRAEGHTLGEISNWLYKNGIISPTGRARWSRETISKLLRNEKYVGDVLLQKTFVQDLFSGRQVKNNGELEKFLIQGHHPPIVSRELFTAANQVGKADF